MEFGLSQEQRFLRDSVQRYLSEQMPLDRVRAFADGTDSTVARAGWHGLAELGISALLLPEAAGGLGLKALDAAVVAQTFGEHVTPGPFLGTGAVAAHVLGATLPQDDPLLAELAAGKLIVGAALSETSGAREDAQITYQATGDGGVLSGRALHVLHPKAHQFIVASRAGALHLVAADAPGLTLTQTTTIDRTRPTCELRFAETPARSLSDDPALLASTLDLARVMIAADTVGAAYAMLQQAVAYAQEREQFNRPIASFQAVKHMCAEMAAALEPCQAMVWYAAHALDALPEEAHLTALHTKAHVSEVGTRVAKTATEVHGGMGFTDLLGLHYWFKRIGFNRQTLGTPDLLRRQAARAQGLLASGA
ncbi:MAG: acyl-CoA dehydrogenase family protein [Pseudomonadota bacterium]